MSPYCVLLSAVTVHIWSESWHCWTLARSRHHLSYDTDLQMLPKLTVSAKLATCEGSWSSTFADSSESRSRIVNWWRGHKDGARVECTDLLAVANGQSSTPLDS